MQNKVDDLVKWLKDQVSEANVNGLVVGISGGIDSAVVANLIKRALPNHSIGVMMPCKSNPDDLKYANQVATAANIDHITIDLTETHEKLFTTVTNVLDQHDVHNVEKDKLADANLRARLRMSTLYTVATNHNYLVVGTDNAAEWYTGYFTKFGDGGIDLAPIINLTKGEVREMAKFLNVPDAVITKQPSAGLWEGQTDETEMGTTYAMIDSFLRGETIPEQDRQIIEAMHQRSAHKREGIKVPN
ncbi:NAD+ synthase [Amphibacillus marinus]|uniref:NH(3)-dependent NAD(+) synthetase n=1 Tax=Amphibacillus marinus TaxID=872970 RepID=A0A1H8P0P7_9BACI|nr:NAD(+) synthase [Amphibacillus marinus]SEO35490.1 NAD+ synthase [Amphibacillus marinus]